MSYHTLEQQAAKPGAPWPLPLSPRQRDVLEFITTFLLNMGYQPSIDEVIQHLGVRQRNAIANHVTAITRKGWINSCEKQGRAIRLLFWPDGRPFLGLTPREVP